MYLACFKNILILHMKKLKYKKASVKELSKWQNQDLNLGSLVQSSCSEHTASY
jgi:hypothetical protein